MQMRKYKLGDIATVEISGVDKKIKDGEKEIRLCNFVDVYYNWAITTAQHDGFMLATASPNEISKFQLKKGQVALTKDSETRDDIGIPTYIADDFDDAILGYHCAMVTPNKDILDGRYLNALLHTDYAKKYFACNASGSGQRYALSVEALNSFPVPMIPLRDQERIGEIFSALDKKIELNRRINQNLEAMAKQLYDYWFVQFDFPNGEGKPYKSSGGKMVWNEKLKREIPQGWNNGMLIDIANITMGQSPDGSSYNEVGEGMLFYQGSTDFGMRFPSVRQYTTAPSRYAKRGDILMSVRAPVGSINIANNDCCIGRGLSAINSKLGSTTHLYYILNDLRIAFEQRNAAGTTFGSITKEDLYSLPIIIPSHEVIRAFDKICSPMFDRQMILGEEIDNLIKQRDGLLPLLMNGQVSVNSDLSLG
ncbi:restriction endonuclease subunit S [Bacteroides ovatus]|jgi:restriction endonuclease S subunit|nr:restriction endonuclease subunit S [Bacteroides ovatus]KAA4183527.1 restriction endonuclease subunit S [Bacteroides ovatus]KAA4192395.1 restriction endonuclease subunit S [Bacteroides ovatus]KAA4378298.1 restriction endonuclease subunit S [Bacteroides ovatus]KAA4444569.1 restriction endonuclease subunit S [Bacteroides ovatus]